MTFTIAPSLWATRTTSRMSFATAARLRDFNSPTFITMSISAAPSLIERLVSYTLALVDIAPKGKPIAAPTLTSEPARAALQYATQ